ncbi:MAG: hypothetical protein GXY36_03505 [Chloroflexi bacterium]|mgnify:CR=1 FL=1|nr:hypothetical protein [Chloroflexota bacterium]
MNTSPKATDPIRKHRREVWLRIIAPVALPALGLIILAVVLMVAFATDALVGQQIMAISGILAIPFVLLPMVLLCVVPYLLAAVIAAGAGRLYANGQKPLRFTRRLTARIAAQTTQYAPKVARPFISLNSRITRWEYTIRGWQQAALPSGKETADE